VGIDTAGGGGGALGFGAEMTTVDEGALGRAPTTGKSLALGMPCFS
jgi:hypothetical protein